MKNGSGTNRAEHPAGHLAIASWYLISDEISFGLRETVEVGLISVCSRNQAAIQIDFSVGALTPRVSMIVWLLFFNPNRRLSGRFQLTSSYSPGRDNHKLKTGYSCHWD